MLVGCRFIFIEGINMRLRRSRMGGNLFLQKYFVETVKVKEKAVSSSI